MFELLDGKRKRRKSAGGGGEGSDGFSNGIDPVQGHGGDEGLPSLKPHRHLDLGPIRDL